MDHQIPYSFVVLTFNDEMHIGRLLTSIQNLHAKIYILDSGSSDKTEEICRTGVTSFVYHPFENHPKQWHAALQIFQIDTPWIIALDADQIISPELFSQLKTFNDHAFADINGIYFNRKNYHRGKWIKHGGYYPFYMLKMFRVSQGFSDLNENMDHRFLVTGKTTIWKTGYLLEENLKENSIQFWLDKHGRYSDLLAAEEVERMRGKRLQAVTPNIWGKPDQRRAYYKMLWWKLPRYMRPLLYFIYRFVFQLGFLDGLTGIIFHFLQGFWFRLLVDIKIDELLNAQEHIHKVKHHKPYRFAIRFLSVFTLLYLFNLSFIGVTASGGLYIEWLDKHLNYIAQWRALNIHSTAMLLKLLGQQVETGIYTLTVQNHSGFRLAYSCLGYGVMSFYAAFIVAFPKPAKSKGLVLFIGLLLIQTLNILRLTTISLFWKPAHANAWIDHHLIFNIIIYAILLYILLIWSRQKNNANGSPNANGSRI